MHNPMDSKGELPAKERIVNLIKMIAKPMIERTDTAAHALAMEYAPLGELLVKVVQKVEKDNPDMCNWVMNLVDKGLKSTKTIVQGEQLAERRILEVLGNLSALPKKVGDEFNRETNLDWLFDAIRKESVKQVEKQDENMSEKVGKDLSQNRVSKRSAKPMMNLVIELAIVSCLAMLLKKKSKPNE